MVVLRCRCGESYMPAAAGEPPEVSRCPTIDALSEWADLDHYCTSGEEDLDFLGYAWLTEAAMAPDGPMELRAALCDGAFAHHQSYVRHLYQARARTRRDAARAARELRLLAAAPGAAAAATGPAGAAGAAREALEAYFEFSSAADNSDFLRDAGEPCRASVLALYDELVEGLGADDVRPVLPLVAAIFESTKPKKRNGPSGRRRSSAPDPFARDCALLLVSLLWERVCQRFQFLPALSVASSGDLPPVLTSLEGPLASLAGTLASKLPHRFREAAEDDGPEDERSAAEATAAATALFRERTALPYARILASILRAHGCELLAPASLKAAAREVARLVAANPRAIAVYEEAVKGAGAGGGGVLAAGDDWNIFRGLPEKAMAFHADLDRWLRETLFEADGNAAAGDRASAAALRRFAERVVEARIVRSKAHAAGLALAWKHGLFAAVKPHFQTAIFSTLLHIFNTVEDVWTAAAIVYPSYVKDPVRREFLYRLMLSASRSKNFQRGKPGGLLTHALQQQHATAGGAAVASDGGGGGGSFNGGRSAAGVLRWPMPRAGDCPPALWRSTMAAKLPLPADPATGAAPAIEYILTAAELAQFARAVRGAPLAIDCEWTPAIFAFGAGEHPASVMQISPGRGPPRVAVVDLELLGARADAAVSRLLAALLNGAPLVVNVGLKNDVAKLRAVIPDLQLFEENDGRARHHHYLDLGAVAAACPALQAFPCARAPSLVLLARDLLGMQVDKADQVQAWHLRPLAASAIFYAGNDAWVAACAVRQICLRVGLKKDDWERLAGMQEVWAKNAIATQPTAAPEAQ